MLGEIGRKRILPLKKGIDLARVQKCIKMPYDGFEIQHTLGYEVRIAFT